jgi:hypothetical protein
METNKALENLYHWSKEASPLTDLEQMFFAYLESDRANDKEHRQDVILTYTYMIALLKEIEKKQ